MNITSSYYLLKVAPLEDIQRLHSTTIIHMELCFCPSHESHFYNTCHILFTSHVHGLAFVSGAKGMVVVFRTAA